MVDILSARLLMQVSQTELSNGTGISRPAIINAERGFGWARTRDAIAEWLTNYYHQQAPFAPPVRDLSIRMALGLSNPGDPNQSKGKRRSGTGGIVAGTCNNTPSPSQAAPAASLRTQGAGIVADTCNNPLAPSLDELKLTWAAQTHDVPAATQLWRDVRLQGRAAIAAFVDVCLRQLWAKWTGTEKNRRKRLISFLNAQANLGKMRRRRRDPEVREKREAIFNIIGPAVASFRKRLTQSKGAYDERSAISRRKLLAQVLDAQAVQEQLMHAVGYIPPLDYCYALYAEKAGRTDATLECQDHFTRLDGPRALYAGHVLYADFTGLKVKLDGANKAIPIGAPGNRNGFQKLWLGNAVDACSGKNWLFPHFADNETAGWPGFLEWLFLEQLQFAPEYLVVDRISGVFDGLAGLSPQRPLSIPAPVALVLLAGTQPYIHQGGRATGGAIVENNNRIAKDEAGAALVRRALLKELTGHGLVRDLRRMNQLEFSAMLGDIQQRMDTRFNGRAGGQVCELWNDQESVQEKRPARALVADARQLWRALAEQVKVGTAHGRLATARIDGQQVRAELDFPAADRCREWPCLVLPCGLRVGDDPAAKRVLLVESTDGQPRLHLANAVVCQKDRWGWDLRRPIFGQGFAAHPATKQDQFARLRDKQAGIYRDRVTALKQGTTNEPVESLGIDAEDTFAQGLV